MTPDELDAAVADAVAVLRRSGASFALLHGSQVSGLAGPESDIDIAAWWKSDPPEAFEVLIAPGVDLIVLNTAPLELAGRIALSGRLVFDDDPAARVRWVATTRKIYSDEEPRLRRSHREFAESVRHRR